MPAAAVGDSPDWPPPGWTEDVKITNGRKIKYYTNVETGKKFYSKKEVSRYMNTKDTCHDVTQAVNNQDKSCSENKVSQMNDQDESLSKNNVNQMNNQDKSCSENNVNQTVGGPNNSYEWLPPGWTVELKTRKSGSHAGTTYKVYIDPSTGDKFYSKPEVSKHLKTMKQNNVAGEVQILGIEKGSVSKKKASQDSEEVGEQSGISKRKKSGIKRLSTKTSPSHGAGEDFPLIEKTSLGSKENGEQRPQSKRQKPGSDCPSTKSVSSVAVDCNSVDELPPGWKKEFINQENDRGTRKDLLYADPVHGYKFRSKKEVLRYLQTGDASRCARRPAKRNAASTTKDDSPVTDDARVKKVGFFMTGRQLFATDESKGGKFFGTCLPAPQVESSKKQLDCSVSDPNIIISSILAEINENHSLENATEDTEIKPVNVGVEQPSAVSTESNVLPEKQILENEPEKPSYKAATQQSRKSRNKESLNLGRRVSKRLAGQNSVVEPNLDPGERALLPVVEKSASPSLSMNVCGQELLQDSDPTLETGNSGQASLNGEASVDELPQGWKKETKITKKAHGIRKDPLYIDPVHGYVFRSKKDVFRYLQTGDINSCAIRPVKRDQDAAMKESSPTAANTNSKNLGCSATEKKSFAAKKSRGRKRSVSCSPEVPAESSKKQAESSVSNANTIITSSAADINAKHSNENVIENAEISLDTETKVRDLSADTKVIGDTNSKNLGCFATERQSFAAKKSRGRKRSVTCSPEVPAESSKKQAESSVSDANTIITSSAADVNAKHSNENVIENAEIDTEPKVRDSSADTKVIPDTNSKNLGCFATERQSFAPKESRGRRRSVAFSPEVPAESSKKQAESSVSNANTIITSSAADINAKHSNENIIENAEMSLDTEPEIRDSSADTVVITDTNSKNLGCFATERQSFAAKESIGRKHSVTCSPEVPAESSKKQAESSVSDANTIITSSAADVNAKHSNENVIENAEIDTEPKVRDSSADTKVIPDTNSKNLGCFATERQSFAPKESRGRRRSVTCSPEVPAESSKKQAESSVSDANTIITSSAADVNAKHSNENVIENAEMSLDTEPEVRDSSADTKVIAAENDTIIKLSAVSTPPPDLPPKQQLPETEHEKHKNKEKLEQSRRSKTKKPLTPGRRISKRLVGHSPEPVADMDLGERAFRAVVKKSASLGTPPDVCGKESSQNRDSTVGTGNSDQTSLSREASGDKLPPGLEKEMLAQNKDPTVGTGNSDQASLNMEASGDKLLPGLEKEMLAQNNDPTVGTGNSDQASLSREASGNELLEKEILAQNRDPIVGTGNSDQASLSREASGNELPPGLEKEIPTQCKYPSVGTGNSDQASPSRKASGNEFSPGLGKEIPTQDRDMTLGTGNSDQASPSRKASGNELSPSLEKEIPNQHKDPMVGTGNSDQASPSRKTSGNELPGLEKEIPTPHKDLTVGTGNTDQASLRREALPDEIPPGWEKEILAQNKYPTVGTGSSDQASLRRKLSPDEIPPGWENVIPAGWKNEIPDQNKDPIVGTRNFDQASLSREAASLDDIPPGWENEILAYKKDPRIRIGNSDQVSLSRESASADELPPGWEKQMLTRNKDPTVGTGNSNSMDDVPPGWEKELFVQTKDRTVGTGNSYQSFPSREASVDELPPGWQKELRPRKSDHGLKDPYYTHPDHGYVFRSKKDVMRYLQTGDIRSCVVRPTKKGPHSAMKDNSPSTLDTSSKKLGCSLTGRQLSATEETKGRKCSVTCSLAVQAESSIERPECSVFNLNVNEDAGRRLDMEPEIRNSIGDRKSVDVESVDDRRSLAISSRSDFHLEQQLPDNEKAKHSNKGVPGRSRKLRNSKSSTPVRRVSKRLSRHNTEMVADFDIGERVLRAVANNSASTGLPLNVSGGKLTLTQQTNLTGDSGPPSLSRRPQDDPLKIVECPSEGQAFKEQNVVNKLSSGKHNEERISEDAQPAGISYESGKVHLERQVVKERSIQKLAKEQDSQNRFLSNSQPAELASGRRVFHAEDQSVSEGSSIEQVSEKLDYENKQWKASHLAEPSWRSVDLNVENQQLQYSQQAPSQGSVDLNVENQQWQYAPVVPSQGSVDLNVENQQWQYSQLAPSQRSVDLNVENQQRQDSQLAPSQRIVDLNVANQQWQDSQLAQPSLRSVDLNVNQPVREKHTGELVTENQDEQNRRLHAQLASYPFGDYWSDPCMEFAFKTLTGAIPVEDNMAYQGSTHQEYSTSYSHADDGCFELPLFNTSNFYMNDAPNHCAPPEVHVVKEQPPINPTFSPTGNNSMPGYSSSVSQNPSLAFPYGSNSTPGFSNVVSQNPGLVFMPNGSNSIPGRGSVVSQNPGMDTQAKDYQSKFRSQR